MLHHLLTRTLPTTREPRLQLPHHLVSPVLEGPITMQARKVRAVVTSFGCSERSQWYPDDGSTNALAAMKVLVNKQTGIFSVAWEYWDEEDGSDGQPSPTT